MKRNPIIICVLMSGLLLSGCANDPSKKRIITRDVVCLNDNRSAVVKFGTIDLLYKANADVPYISLKDGARYINEIRKEAISKDSILSLNQEGDKATYTTPDNAKAEIDIKDQTITYTDFEGLLSHTVKYSDTYALVSPEKGSSIHLLENNYEKGNSYTINLNSYSQIDIYKHGDDFYLPLTTYNDLFFNPICLVNLVYRFDKVFLLASDSFTTEDEEGETILTTLGKAFYDKKADNPTVSKGYAEYYYQNICLNFDYLYGVKGIKGRDYTSFDAYLSSKGYKEDLLSGNVKKMDAAYAYATSTLRDFHTALSSFSPLYTFGQSDIDIEKLDPYKVKEEKDETALNLYRIITKAGMGFSVDEENRIAYIAFNEFSPVDEKALKKESWSEEDLANSVTLFAYAYKQIVDNYLGKISYVAIDLATNEGGSSDGLVYMLGTLLGRFSVEIKSPFTGAHSKSTYMIDINRDGKVDEADVSLREYGMQIVFIDTHYAFSCGNALPVLAKNNYPDNVTTIGETTGGGTCVVRPAYTALGSMYNISGLQMLATKKGDALENIEGGVAADIALDGNLTIVRSEVVKALKSQQ